MECKNIIYGANRLLGTAYPPSEENVFLEKAAYILATLFSEVGDIDKKYREAFGLPPQPEYSLTYVSYDDEFPLCDRFVSAAEFYLASLIIFEVDESRSDFLYEKYCDSICSITESIPAMLEKTSNVY